MDALKRRMHLRQETSHLLVDVLYGFDAGIQSSGLHRRLPGAQLGSNFKEIKAWSAKRHTLVCCNTNKV
jgi:hypothetical protein